MQRAMGRRGVALASCCRGGVRHNRFAVWPARRAKETGIVTVGDRASPLATSIEWWSGEAGGRCGGGDR